MTDNIGIHPLNSSSTLITVAAFYLLIFIATLDAVIVGNALPAITEDLRSSESLYAWVGAAYNMAWAALLPTAAQVSEIFGRKPVVLGGAAVFSAGSIWAALSPTMTMLIAGRVVQGLGAGTCLASVSVSIADMFALRDRAVFYAGSGAVMALGGAVAPLIGGAFAQSPQSGWMGWRWCFWICLPLTAIATALIAFFFHPHNPRTSLVDGLLSIDWLGTILISGAAIMLQLGLQFGGEAFSWTSPTVLCLLIFSAVTFGLFVVVEAKIPSKPITPARLVDDRSSAALLFIAIIHGFCYISIIFYLPLYFQMVLGATAVQAGVWLLIGTLTMPVCTIASGLFMKQAGRFVPPIRTACLFMTIGFGLFISFPAHLSWARIAVFQVVLAFGLGPLFQAPVLALQAHVSQEDAGAANSLLLFVRTISAAVGLIAGQTVLHNQLRTFARNAGMSSEAVKAMFSNSGAQSLAAMNLNPAQEALVSQAIAKALSSMWILYTVVAFLALVASWFVEERELTIRAVSDPEAPMLVRAATLNGRDSKGEC